MKHIALFVVFLAACAGLGAQRGAGPQTPSSSAFQIEEATITQIHDALRARALTCRGLVEQYLARIDALDKRGPSVNAIVLINPEALATADELDRRAASGGPMRPLECVPVIVKDNYET
jgi:Asp-tRNA(Asn)/Glu-tRNA(Gln) amidotransferase A subunit family amidase